MIDLKEIPIIRNLNINIIKTSFPLIISILSYPLFTAVIIASSFSFYISYFILGQAIITIYIRFCENLLSGTRVLTAQNVQNPIDKRHAILNTSWSTSILFSIIGLLSAFVFWLVTYLFIKNSYFIGLSCTIMCLAVGAPGIFIYNTCAFYLHAHKQTHMLPIISWIANIIGAVLMYVYATSPNSSFLICIILASLSRWVLAFLACLVIPAPLKGAQFYRVTLEIKQKIYLAKFGFSHAINSLFFTGSYFLFSLFLEMNASDELPTFQVQLCLLGIFSVINSAIINSGCIIFSQLDKSNLQARNKLMVDNFVLNSIVITILLTTTSVFRQPILSWMGSSEISFSLFEATYVLFIGIYLFDILQMFLMQAMTYNNDYLLPPLIRIIIFAAITLPLAFATIFFFEQGLHGLLASILIGTVASSIFIIKRFKETYVRSSVNAQYISS